MSRKNILEPSKVISAGVMAGDITQAKPTNIQWLDNVAIQLNFTGTPTGTFYIEGSLDYNPITNISGSWVAITLSTPAVAAGSANQILLDLNQLSFPWIRVRYTATSGSGSLDAYISGKEV